ncbi:MAG TPA: alpha/beta hydrolase [Gemmatimonadaceae bacterium]|nr:alpha/beta hydrolase [Gemmatimonadaceae bacterium]
MSRNAVLLLVVFAGSLAAQEPASVRITPENATRIASDNAAPGSGACEQFQAAALDSTGAEAEATFVWMISNPGDFRVDARTGEVCARRSDIEAVSVTLVTATMVGSQLSATVRFTVVPDRGQPTGTPAGMAAAAALRRDMARLEALDPPSINDPRQATEFTAVQIYYGTDRRAEAAEEPDDRYGAERGPLELGTAIISIPRGHKAGQLESPSWLRLEFSEDPSRHVVLLRVTPLEVEGWVSSFDQKLDNSPQREALVFLHGYNVTFAEAARRTAQLAYDLGYEGVPVLYSWPSRGTLAGYLADEATVERSVPHFQRFLRLLAFTGVDRIHVVAHSMGNRVLAGALRNLAPDVARRIGQVVLTAPDIDAEVFETQVVPAMRQLGVRLTMYSSSADRALQASMKVHGYRRAGQSGDSIVVVPGLETVDASHVDTDLLGHGYFAEDKPVLDDLFLLLKHELPATARQLKELLKGALRYWAFR